MMTDVLLTVTLTDAHHPTTVSVTTEVPLVVAGEIGREIETEILEMDLLSGKDLVLEKCFY